MWERMGEDAGASSAWSGLVVLEGFISMCNMERAEGSKGNFSEGYL